MDRLSLAGRVVLVTGAARRIGRALALATAGAGADVIIHYNEAEEGASRTEQEIEALGRRAWTVQANFAHADGAERLIEAAFNHGPLFGLVNSAAVFEARSLGETSLQDWDRHLAVNLTAPFLLAQAFGKRLGLDADGRIVNILDWRALRPGADHFAYTISKAALAAMTRSLAIALAPRISVNGLALGAILPPADGSPAENVLKDVPAGRWGRLPEVEEALLFLLSGPAYVTGEIIHVDGGRHLV